MPVRQGAQIMNDKKTTDFGYSEVAQERKAGLVAGVFDLVAERYDLMNDLMSAGIHRLWKRFAIEVSAVRPGQRVLDIAGGTGDLAARFSSLVGARGEVILADINASMLNIGRDRLLDRGIHANLACVQADAENLPFPDHCFDIVSIAFGLRNVTRKEDALQSMLRVLKPGGRLVVLEFSKPGNEWLARAYDAYSFKVLPALGKLVAGDSGSYQYLAESIRRHPGQETLKEMMEEAGYVRCEYFNLSGGIVALHKGMKA